jgi:hypothetical protein
MPQTLVYLDEELDKEVVEFSKKTNLGKPDSIIRLIKLGLKAKEKQ